ncbi:MAG: acetoacetate decarboxylase family protein [Marmoricola sp.]
MPYPDAPWPMHGQLWLSLFRVRAGDHPDRPAGVYGAALVAYEAPSPLTYSELLVARPVNGPVNGKANITDIWVDSADSRDGGRELWAIPKDLGAFEHETTGGKLQRTSWSASLDGRPIATARFTDISRATFRTPFRGGTRQQFPVGHARAGAEVVAPLSGSARALPCRGSWDFDEQGPLAWLAGKRPLMSLRMADFAMSFG